MKMHVVVLVLVGLMFVGTGIFRATFNRFAPVVSAIRATVDQTDEDIIAEIEDVIDSAGEAPPEPEPVPVKPEQPVTLKSTIVPHVIDGCIPCARDKAFQYPRYRKAGWTVADPINETKAPKGSYPWYEIYDAQGRMKKHVGSLADYR